MNTALTNFVFLEGSEREGGKGRGGEGRLNILLQTLSNLSSKIRCLSM